MLSRYINRDDSARRSTTVGARGARLHTRPSCSRGTRLAALIAVDCTLPLVTSRMVRKNSLDVQVHNMHGYTTCTRATIARTPHRRCYMCVYIYVYTTANLISCTFEFSRLCIFPWPSTMSYALSLTRSLLLHSLVTFLRAFIDGRLIAVVKIEG